MNVKGTTLRERYKIFDRVGAGGMGEVYRAADIQLGDAPVAVKRLLISPSLNEQRDAIVEQFMREARILRALKHDNIPRVYDCFEENGHLYLVMDFVEGVTLAATLKSSRPSAETVLGWARQIASALHYLHTREPLPVIYRDLKPENLMVTDENRVMLLDFGLAKGARAEHAGTMLKGAGTLAYSSPEQLDESGRPTDARSDLYSLGATLYALLAGKLPTSSLIRAQAQTSGRPDPLRLDEIDPRFHDLLHALTALDPAARPQTAQDVIHRLDALQTEASLPLLRSGPTLAAGGRPFRAPRLPEAASVVALPPTAAVAEPMAPVPAPIATAEPPPEPSIAPETVAPALEAESPPTAPPEPETPSLTAEELEAAYAQTVVPFLPPADTGDARGLRGFRGAAPKRLEETADTPTDETPKKKGWLW